MLKRSFEF